MDYTNIENDLDDLNTNKSIEKKKSRTNKY